MRLSFWSRICLLLILAGATGAAASEGPAELAWDLRCETGRLALGDPRTAWTWIEGLDAGPRGGGSFARAEDAASLLLLLKPGGDRQLEVVARGRGSLAARLNDRHLGERPLARGWSTLAWSLPAAAIRPGANVLRLERRGEPRRRGRDRYGLRQVRVEPAACGAAALGGALEDPGRPLSLAPGQLLISRRGWSAPSRLDLEVRTRWPPTAVAVDCFSARTGHRLLEVSGGRRLTAVERLALEGSCAAAAGLTVAALGPDEARIREARVVPRPTLSWRLRIALAAAVLFALAAAGLLLAARRAGRARPKQAVPRPWRDAAAVVAVGVAARLLFLAFYPYPGHADDSWEYLTRARTLADGSAGFWNDSSWHAWQTFSRPPGYFAFLAAAVGEGGSTELAVALQLLFSALTAGAVVFAARPLFGRRAALVAGLLFALYLPSITTFSTLMSEPLYMLFMVPALAAVAWTATSPRRATAVAAGVLFGLAALVRSGPLVLAPITAAPLVAALGWRRGLRAAGWMVAAALLTVLPWIARNSILAGELAGVDDIAVANLLQTHPDPRFVPTDGLDLETEEGFQAYYWRIKAGNAGRELSRQQGAIMRSVLARLARDPAAAARRFRSNITALLAPRPDEDLRWILGDHHRVRLAWLNSFLAAQYLFVLIAGAAGLVLTARRRAAWPLAAWLLASLVIVSLIFYYEPRFRLQTMPCLMVFAGAAICRLLGGPRRGDRDAATAPPVVQKVASKSLTTSIL